MSACLDSCRAFSIPVSWLKTKVALFRSLLKIKTHPPGPLSRRQFQLLRSHSDTLLWIDGVRIAPANVDLGGGSEIAIVAAVMPNLADALSLSQNGGVWISRRMWQREFGSSIGVVGQQIQINNTKLPITGIAPDQLEGLYRDQTVDLWTSLPALDFQGQNQEARDVWVLARIRDGVSIGDVQRDIRQQSRKCRRHLSGSL